MYCPVCDDVRMKEVNKNHVLVDVCPNCKGVWLDRGELDKLLKQVSDVEGPYIDRQRYDRPPEYNEDHHYKNYNDDYDDYHHQKHYHQDYDNNKYPKRKKKKSVMDMLGDIFD
ncbi:TFIIB-type zinc ribbon-containing protein [Terrilactibacillus laevilacticus]|uniref:Zf-TFIIB domain-containing protein n=1 Tax=Terrilactibacillus laevilacticus TaxID=1380157 RepID=A0ABW5PLS5_9BACI